MNSRKLFVSFILFLWQLPQNLIGSFLLAYLKTTKGKVKIEFSRNRIFIMAPFSVSLGLFIFYDPAAKNIAGPESRYDIAKEHEYGHSVQSQLLGPLYLIVIGLPSLIWAIYFKSKYKKNNSFKDLYFTAYTEKWADKLAKIERFHKNT